VLFTLTLLGRGDVLAFHSCALESSERGQCMWVMSSKDAAPDACRVLFQAMGAEKLGEFIGEQEAQIKKVNEDFSKQVEDLQKLYEGYMKDKEAAEAALKGQGLGLAKAVRKSLEAKTDEL